VIDPILSPEVWNKNKSRREKITTKTGLSELTRIVTWMNRDVRWAKFDTDKAIRPDATDAQSQANKAIREADENEQEAAEDYEIKQAHQARVKAELDPARPHTRQAQEALEAARAELRTNCPARAAPASTGPTKTGSRDRRRWPAARGNLTRGGAKTRPRRTR
jgi:hypothetical protein